MTDRRLYDLRIQQNPDASIWISKWTETSDIDVMFMAHQAATIITLDTDAASALGWALISAAAAKDEPPADKQAEVIALIGDPA